MKHKSGKSALSFILFLLAGVVLGGFLGYYLGRFPYFQWLDYGRSFGLSPPVALDLGIISLSFGFMLKFNICGIIGMTIAVLLHWRLRN